MEQGAVIWLTGTAASGKSTIGGLVGERLRERGLRVEDLDSDEVRQNLSPNLGYTIEARDENTKRLAWMGKVLGRNGVHVVVAAVSSLRRFRDRAREMCPHFVEVWVKAPLEVCKARDPKGLYARAARGEVNDIAGWHQPYEEPLAPEVICDTVAHSAEQCADQIMARLVELGYIPPEGGVYTPEQEEAVAKRLGALGYL